VSARFRQLADHVRRLGDDDLNDLLVELPKNRFTALADAALTRPVLPAGLLLRFERAGGIDGKIVVACAPRRTLGTVARDASTGGQPRWRAWTRHGDLVRVAGFSGWRRRADAAAALAWVMPVSGARCLALAAYVRALGDLELNDLLVELPVDRFDGLLDAAFGSGEGVAA